MGLKDEVKMIQVLGTASNVGKTTLTVALCRILSKMGYGVAPFKSVNMSLNSIAIDGGSEISRSVWLQAVASGIAPKKEMNPFMLKPEADGRSQVIVLGKSEGVMPYGEYGALMLKRAPGIIEDCLLELSREFDVIVAEGAGSTAEINFNGRDFANSWVSSLFETPALLVGDIDRGGVFASLYGSLKLMEHSDRVKWLVINRMRGDRSLLESGMKFLEHETGRKVIGVIPHAGESRLPGEDSMDYISNSGIGRIAVVNYPFMENHSDLDPLILREIGFGYVDERNMNSLRDAEVVILPGSKDVARDLAYLKKSGIGEEIKNLATSNVTIMGICGGYQMLGESIEFRDGTMVDGLGLLKCETQYSSVKTVRTVRGTINGTLSPGMEAIRGYEIHYGDVSSREDSHMLDLEYGDEGSVSSSGNVMGTNIHGLLESAPFMSTVLAITGNYPSYDEVLEENIERISSTIAENIDLEPVLKYLGKSGLT